MAILVAFCHPLAFPELQIVNIFIIVGLKGDNEHRTFQFSKPKILDSCLAI